MSSRGILSVFAGLVMLCSSLAAVSAASPSADSRVAISAKAEVRDRLLDRGRSMAEELARSERAGLEARFGRYLPLPELELSADEVALGSAKGRVGDRARALTSDWTPYTGPFTYPQAAHLLRRGMIGPRVGEMRTAAILGLDQTVAQLLAPRALPLPPGPWALEPVPDVTGWTSQMIDSLVTLYFTRDELLKLWWSQAIIRDDPGITEAMTLFWHDHFATADEKVLFPQSMYKQNQLLRQYATGNFKDARP